MVAHICLVIEESPADVIDQFFLMNVSSSELEGGKMETSCFTLTASPFRNFTDYLVLPPPHR